MQKADYLGKAILKTQLRTGDITIGKTMAVLL